MASISTIRTPYNTQVIVTIESASAAAAPAAYPPQSQPPTTGDQATFSAVSSVIAQAFSASPDDVRLDRISSIQRSLATGSYNIATAAVAAKLLDSLLA